MALITRLTKFLTDYLAAEDILKIADAFLSKGLLPRDVYDRLLVESVKLDQARLMVSSLHRKVQSQPSNIKDIIDVFKHGGHLDVVSLIENELGKF